MPQAPHLPGAEPRINGYAPTIGSQRRTLTKRPTCQKELDDLTEAFEPVKKHIKAKWDELTRDHEAWFLGALEDKKIPEGTRPPYYLYIPPDETGELTVKVREEVNAAYEKVIAKINAYEEDQSLPYPRGIKPVMRTRLEDDPDFKLPPQEVATLENIISPSDIRVVPLKRNLETGELEPPVELNHETGDYTGKVRDPETGDLATKHGLLYLPHPYIVPGVRYNEMYDWDSAFVVRGLLQDGEFDKAKFLVDNMLFQIENYGTVLNGNRTYYLDSKRPRSQPPLVTAKIEAIYNNFDKMNGEESGETKEEWLKNALKIVEKDHGFWLKGPHVVLNAEENLARANSTADAATLANQVHDTTHLSMYNSDRTVPSDEVEFCEPGHYDTAFQQLNDVYKVLKTKLRTEHGVNINDILKSPLNSEDDVRLKDAVAALQEQERKDLYYIEQYIEFGDDGNPEKLSGNFYRGDWAMRESGFDPSRRFGFFNVDVINHVPVCLNSLRYKMEQELSTLSEKLKQDDPENIEKWHEKHVEWAKKAAETKDAMQQLWDTGDSKRMPAFRDLNINNDLQEKYNLPPFRDYDYATALFPMWAGVATQEQADQIANYICPKLINDEYGLITSTHQTGAQWDKPMMWAPLQIAAMEGLERYGYYEEAWKIGTAFAKTIINEFNRPNDNGVPAHNIREKYAGTSDSANTGRFVTIGYKTNDVGFAWTNSAASEIMASLPRLLQKMRRQELTVPDTITTTNVPTEGIKYAIPMVLEPTKLAHSM